MLGLLKPDDSINEKSLEGGLKNLLFDGVCSQVMAVLTGGAFLAAFALSLGASNKVIGMLAAIGPLCQIMQIPAIYLIEYIRVRKALVVINVLISRSLWVITALLPWFMSGQSQISILLLFLVIINALNAIAGCSWNSWIRDLVPDTMRASYFAKRLTLATAVGAVVSLLAGFSISWLKPMFEQEARLYSFLFLFASVFGFIGLWFLSRTPEPLMPPSKPAGLIQTLAEPFKDTKFRSLLLFLGNWNFAINLAAPFFTVYMLKRLNMSMSWIIGLSVLSQLVNVVFFKIWARLADRFTNKSCLSVAGFLFVISIVFWPFTTLPDKYWLTIPLLLLIHVLSGISTAGVALCSGNITLKFAPNGRATSYLAVNGLVNGAVATLAPLLAGISADWFEKRELKLTLSWIVDTHAYNIPAIDLKGLDFLFILAFLLGLYSLHRLLAVKESGEVDEKIVYSELIAEMRQSVRNVTTVSGLKYFTLVPFQAVVEKVRDIVRDEKK